MSKIQWEYDLVERPFCEQLKAMGWQWIEGDTDVPELTERANFREVLLKGRLATALRRLNLRDGQPSFDDDRIRHFIEKLEKAEGHRLMKITASRCRWRSSRVPASRTRCRKPSINSSATPTSAGKSGPRSTPTTKAWSGCFTNQLLIVSNFFESHARDHQNEHRVDSR